MFRKNKNNGGQHWDIWNSAVQQQGFGDYKISNYHVCILRVSQRCFQKRILETQDGCVFSFDKALVLKKKLE